MFNVEGWLASKGINYSASGNNVGRGWIGTACPWCGDEKNHLGINLAKLTVYCWKCSTSTHITKFIQEVCQCSYSEAKDIVEEKDKGRTQLSKPLIKPPTRPKNLTMPDGIKPGIMNIHRKFLISRGFDSDYIAKKYKLYNGGINGQYRFKMAIPYYKNQQLMTFSFRDISGPVRYKHYSEDQSLVSAKHMLYNQDNCNGSTVVIVEGPSDVWRCGNSFLATSGTQWTNEQLALLIKYERVFVMFDAGEPEAQRQARNLATALSPFVIEVEVLNIGVGDPGDLSEKEVKYIRGEVGV